MLGNLISPLVVNSTRPSSPAEREKLDVRLRRLYNLEPSYRQATANLATLADAASPGTLVASKWIRIRDPFTYRADAAGGVSSDRKLPPKADRPPAARLVTPRGAALRLMLIALFEAQARVTAGKRPDNQRPLQAAGNVTAWSDLLATDAKPAGAGRTFMNVPAKKGRHLFSALDLLHKEDLISLPNGEKTRNKHAGFLLNNEIGKRTTGPNVLYTVPLKDEPHLLVPVSLFTNGWIHVLEDSELRYLLMLCYFHGGAPAGFKVTSDVRLQHMGIGPDAYEAHVWFTRFELNRVIADSGRHANGTVDDYGDDGVAIPHTLQLLPAGFDNDALKVVTREIDAQLER